ncbi:MAG: hypothetical protein AAFP90_12180 [Planctomycetota bacterium]
MNGIIGSFKRIDQIDQTLSDMEIPQTRQGDLQEGQARKIRNSPNPVNHGFLGRSPSDKSGIEPTAVRSIIEDQTR